MRNRRNDMTMKELKKRHFINYSILIPYLILSVLGLIMVFSATVPHQIELGLPPYQLFRNQTIFFAFSLVMIVVIYRIKVDKLRSRNWFGILIPVMLVLLFIARFFVPTVNGAHGWIIIPGIGSIQPAEYLKLVAVWFLSATFASKQEKFGLMISMPYLIAINSGSTLLLVGVFGWLP